MDKVKDIMIKVFSIVWNSVGWAFWLAGMLSVLLSGIIVLVLTGRISLREYIELVREMFIRGVEFSEDVMKDKEIEIQDPLF